MNIYLKRLHIDIYGLIVAGILVLALILRLILISQNWPVLDSDEGTMGIMALHIAYHGATPIFFYGQNYMGALEAYVAAPLFYLWGPSPFALHVGLLIIYSCAFIVMYLLVSTLYTRQFALFILVLLALGSSEMFARQLTATGGYPESFLLQPLLLLTAFKLASSSQDTGRRRRRILAYAGWIALAGFAIWSDPLMIPFILVSGWLLLRFCSRELPWRPITLFVAACVALVTILYIASSPYSLNESLTATLRFIFRTQGSTFTISPLGARITGTLLVALPRATGWNVPCYIPNDGGPSLLPPHPLPTSCLVGGGIWSAGFLLLLVISIMLTITAYRTHRRPPQTQVGTYEQRQAAIRDFARLMLLVGALFTLLLYTNSSAPALDPWISTRYLVSLPIALPAVLWPLWQMGQDRRKSLFALGFRILRHSLLLAIMLVFLLGWVQTLALIPEAQHAHRQDTVLISSLLKLGITHISTDYWTCDRIAFESAERIICRVVDGQLQPGFNRSPFYAPIVAADPRAAWVLPLNSLQAKTFAQKAPQILSTYRLLTMDGYVIYIPHDISPSVYSRNRGEPSPHPFPHTDVGLVHLALPAAGLHDPLPGRCHRLALVRRADWLDRGRGCAQNGQE